jgi:predicted TIM-barrel enzyme
VPPPVDDINDYASPFEKAQVDHALAYSAVGSARTVEEILRSILGEARPDELIVTGHFYDHAARLRSFEIAARVRDRLAVPPVAVSAELRNSG